MIRVKITMGNSGFPAKTQLPNGKPVWGNCEFYMNQDIKECDYWIVWGSMHKKESTICPKENIIFIAGEPPSVYRYEKRFLNQFSKIVTCDRNTNHKNPIYEQQSLPWWLGHDYSQGDSPENLSCTTYDSLRSSDHIKKNKILSMIVSDKQTTEGHRKRFEFAKKIKEHFKDQIDIFGIDNKCRYKWDAIAPYKYHIAIENSCFDDYWTEKLSDSILAESYTFYYGCKNLNKYFDKDIYTEINIDNFESSAEKIESIIQNQAYEKGLEKIIESKNLILDKYQLFAAICNMCSNSKIEKRELVTIKPESAWHKTLHKINQKIWN